MTRRRFYAPSAAFRERNSIVVLTAEEARHLRDVLRLRAGDEVFVFDGEGREFRCNVEDIGRHETRLSVVEEAGPARPESRLQLTLAIALLKGEKIDLVVQKATELGAARVALIESEHADVRIKSDRDADRRISRLRRIALEAAKQSGRARVPTIDGPVAYGEFIMNRMAGMRLFFSERDGRPLGPAIESGNISEVTALIGPEGGWSDDEIEAARAAGWLVITLGGRILRAETAAIAVTTLLQHLFGDLR
jgi:16S rRNA (uracil1498-N3)-methyltransferase